MPERTEQPPPPVTPATPRRFPLDALRQDLRDTTRTLGRQPSLAAAAVVTLALAIGATTAIFSVVNGVLINPLPYPDSDRLVRIVHSIGGVDQPYFNDAIYGIYADNTQAFQDLGVWSPGATATVTGRGEPEEVRTLTATRGVLTTLGVRPEIGRVFSTADDTPGAPDAVMLGHGYWHRRFGGDRAVLERVLTINARPHQIVGVAPAGVPVRRRTRPHPAAADRPRTVDTRLPAPGRREAEARHHAGAGQRRCRSRTPCLVRNIRSETRRCAPAGRHRFGPSNRMWSAISAGRFGCSWEQSPSCC